MLGANATPRSEARAASPAGGRARAILGTASATHFVHDGFSDLLYLLFPVWAAQFGLSFAQVGLLKTAYSAGMVSFQVPAGLLAERWGERRLLAAGTAVTALGFVLVGLGGGFAALLACLLLGGFGSGVQHPLSSSLVSKAYESGPRRMALGAYNFSGDLGKIAVPAGAALALPWIGWRGVTQGYAVVGLVAAALILVALSRLRAGDGTPTTRARGAAPANSGWGIRDPWGYTALSTVQVIDNATRTAFLTFLPFLLIAKGATVRAVGLALLLVFAGGAAGKFAFGALAERIGVIRSIVVTEVATGAGIITLLGLPLTACFLALPVLGTALNGTSSVLYATVADLVESDRRARSYAIFYTLGVTASAVSPFAYGILSDHRGVPVTVAVVGAVVLLTVPFALALRRPLSALPAASAR